MDGKDDSKRDGPPSEELSRDDVKAQREAKKQAKAARKNKSLGKAEEPGGATNNVEPMPPPPTKNQEKGPKPKAEKKESDSLPANVVASVTSTEPPAKDGPPSEGGEMSREEVMAQRAEKKKQKEARKNKSGETIPKPKPEQQKQQQKQSSESSSSKQQQPQNKKPREQQQKQAAEGPKRGKPEQGKGPGSASVTETAAPAGSKAAETGTEGPTTEVPAVDSASEASKLHVLLYPEKFLGKNLEYQSTIHSLFRPKKTGEKVKDANFKLHPLFHNLGVRLKNDVIRGTNQRCITLLHTVKDYVQCYETPSGMTLKHGLSTDLRSNLDTLRLRCPFAIGMNNGVDFVNAFLYELAETKSDVQNKEDIMEMIDTYIEEKIEKAVEAIVFHGVEKIRSGDVIMIYSITEALLHLLAEAAERGTTFELIVIQTPENMPDLPILLKRLGEPIKKRSVTISCVNFSNAIYRMRHCSKLIIGGHGLFTTGGVMAQSGSGKLALLAATYNKPAVFLCETFKFCDRSPLDFFTLDEYVHENSIVEDDLFEPKIKYDVTPANLVTVVITDIDVLPSTSVPVVLRVQEGRSPRKHADASESP